MSTDVEHGEHRALGDPRYWRWLAWYHRECMADCQPDREAVWPEREFGESIADYIVRSDVPSLLAELATAQEHIAKGVAAAAYLDPSSRQQMLAALNGDQAQRDRVDETSIG